MSGELEIIQIVGRWARLSNGDCVTAIQPFHKLGEPEFSRAIARFHRDPVGTLAAGIVQTVPAPRKPAS